MCPIGLFGVIKAELLIGSIRNANPKFRDLPRCICVKCDAKCLWVYDDETVATKCCVDCDRAKSRHLKRHVQSACEGGKIFDINALGLAVDAVGTHAHQTTGGFEHHLCHRLLHRDNAAIEQHG